MFSEKDFARYKNFCHIKTGDFFRIQVHPRGYLIEFDAILRGKCKAMGTVLNVICFGVSSTFQMFDILIWNSKITFEKRSLRSVNVYLTVSVIRHMKIGLWRLNRL